MRISQKNERLMGRVHGTIKKGKVSRVEKSGEEKRKGEEKDEERGEVEAEGRGEEGGESEVDDFFILADEEDEELSGVEEDDDRHFEEDGTAYGGADICTGGVADESANKSAVAAGHEN